MQVYTCIYPKLQYAPLKVQFACCELHDEELAVVAVYCLHCPPQKVIVRFFSESFQGTKCQRHYFYKICIVTFSAMFITWQVKHDTETRYECCFVMKMLCYIVAFKGLISDKMCSSVLYLTSYVACCGSDHNIFIL